jgi:hypothetical protein
MPTNIQGTPTRGLLLTPAQIANLPSDQQAAYMSSLSPSERNLVNQEVANQKVANNRAFMRKAIERYAYCPVSGGSTNIATYTPGTTLYFDFPVVGGGYAKGMIIRYTINFTTATGTTWAPNPAAPFNIFSELQIVYNGAQVRTHPYILKVLYQVEGYGKYGQQDAIAAGLQNDASINALLGVNAPAAGVLSNTANLPTALGANTWSGMFYLPLNVIGLDTVPGLLPVMGVGNKPQVKLVCAPAFQGNDPLLNPIYQASGAAGTTSVANTSTISVDMVYQDGTTMSDPNGIAIDITTEPTLQYYWDTPLNPLSTGLLMRQHIATLLEHWYVVCILIDGQKLGAFSAVNNTTNGIGNVTSFQLSADSVGQQNFYSFNVANNIPVQDYYDRLIRRVHGQDLDDGVFLWVDAPGRGVLDADNRNGVQVLNMQPGGYPATTHAYQVTATQAETVFDGGAKATPRVECLLISMNYNGLRLT